MKNLTMISLRISLTLMSVMALVSNASAAMSPACIICGDGPNAGMMICPIWPFADPCPPFNRSGNPKNIIERTFKSPKSKHTTQKMASNCLNPDLDISIDSTDMADLLAVGNIRLFIQKTDTAITNMDVGLASEDTQFWQMPIINYSSGLVLESIDPNQSPYINDFDTSNVVYAGIDPAVNDSVYVHYQTSAEDILQLGVGNNNLGDPYILDWFETEAFLPIECGWEILETITTFWAFDPEIDSLVENKDLVTQSTGMFTPINEDPVPAILLFLQYDFEEYKDGLIIESGGYNAMIWFTTSGHKITGYLDDGAPTEGITQFAGFTYDKNIHTCPPVQDFGLGLPEGTYAAQDLIKSAAALTQGPIQFVSGQDIELKNGFASTNELNLFIDPDPCNF